MRKKETNKQRNNSVPYNKYSYRKDKAKIKRLALRAFFQSGLDIVKL